MADKIFGQGLNPIPLKLDGEPVVTPAFEAAARPIQIAGLGTTQIANATDAASVITQLNALLAVLRTAGVIKA